MTNLVKVQLILSLCTLAVEMPNANAEYVSLQSHNYTFQFIRHSSYRGYISAISTELDQMDATFDMVPGLADSSCFSFISYNYPGYYLRHRSKEIWLDPYVRTQLFEEDATFCQRDGLADPSKVTFESYNYPGHFIRHRGSKLYINSGSGALFRADSTFKITRP